MKVTSIMHEAPAASVAAHLLVNVNAVEPLLLIDLIPAGTLSELVMVTI